MSFAIIVFVVIIFVQHIITTGNYNLILPASIFSVVIVLIFSTLLRGFFANSEDKENHSASSTAGLIIATSNNNNSDKLSSIDEVETTIPDPIQSGYDIPLM
ncbi:MAG: hypothetical protein CXT70_01145 [Methanobacteriota archaeon]|nr:MAG: hypothetical protein CXT70_01145 [Euryarchaeota archaeon]